jgi:SAM-dependent methyltransferase
MQNYLEVNRSLWNKRTITHIGSDFYDVEGWLKGKSLMSPIEVEPMGDLNGKNILHLQCHFGQDTLTMARKGATVTGVDLSEKAIEEAVKLSRRANLDARFICCDLYNLPNHLDEQFDIVFSSYGTIGWLPNIQKWASIVARYLKPGGKFHFAEFHPAVWMFDDALENIVYSYFNKEAIIETEEGTYADKEADIHQEAITWNHTIGDVVSALLNEGLNITALKEYDKSPFDIFQNTTEKDGWYYPKGLEGKLPLVYYVEAKK